MAKTSMIVKVARKPKFMTRKVNRCKQCGRPRGYLRKFGVCRLCFRQLALNGEIPGVMLHDLGPHPAAIVTFTVRCHGADAVKTHLAEAHINVSTSSPSSTLLDATRRALPAIVRASPHYYNTEEEIDRLTSAIRELAG